MRLERINQLEDPRVAAYRDVRDADLARRRGLFMAEGELVIRRLLRGELYRTQSLLLSESRLATMQDALDEARPDLPVYIASQEVMDQVVGFHIHRGALAAGERGRVPEASELISSLAPGSRTVLLLEDLANHDNIGGVMRNALAFGVDAALLTRRCCDPLYRKAIRVSVGAALDLPFAYVDSAKDGAALLRAAGFTTIALTPSPDASELSEYAAGAASLDRVALLLGAEGPGLTPQTMQHADVQARLAMAPGADSLNVATASGVALYALSCAR
ncbi:MAG: RNA methyltransferase [Phycisphaeraceae bacterium]|nr:MAG: RNA methyltransferase [Phycisphaeraceae bacterium]